MRKPEIRPDNFLEKSFEQEKNNPSFTKKDLKLFKYLVDEENTIESIWDFDANYKEFSPFAYWRILGLLYIKDGSQGDLPLWKKMFSRDIPEQKTGLMTEDELAYLKAQDDEIAIIRVHHKDEEDWISYTTDFVTSFFMGHEFSLLDNFDSIKVYIVNKKNVLAYFNRHNENEIIVLNKNDVTYYKTLMTNERAQRINKAMEEPDEDEK